MTPQEQLLMSMPDAMILTDRYGTMQIVNHHVESLFGYTSDELIGNPVEMLVPQFSRQMDMQHADPTASALKAMEIKRRLTVRKKDGKFFPISISISPVTIDGVEEIIVSIRDMTEYENLANQFQQAQKMEALGTLVGGVSHDFNNLINMISASAHMAKKQSADNPPVIAKIEEIERQCAAAQETIAQLLAFSREEKTDMKPFSLTALIRDSLKLYAAAIPRSIQLDADLPEAGLKVMGSGVQVQQVVLNLLNNARDALAEAQEKYIRISLQAMDVDPLLRDKNPRLKSDRYALLSVSDTGHGIPHDVVKKIFEPFFTTKPAASGTGLGLAMVYSTVEAHQGIIEVESHEGKGTYFRIFLPLI